MLHAKRKLNLLLPAFAVFLCLCSGLASQENGSKDSSTGGPRDALQSIVKNYQQRMKSSNQQKERQNIRSSTLKDVNEFLKEHPDQDVSEHAKSLKATLLTDLGNLSEAVELLQNMIVKYDTSQQLPSYYLRLGDVLVKQGEEDRALQIFQTIQEKFPGSSESLATHIRIGDLYERKRQYEKAQKELEKGANQEEEESSIRAKFLLGRLYLFLGENKKAKGCFSYVQKHSRNPGYIQAANRELNQMKWIGSSLESIQGKTLTGEEVSTDDYRGKVLLIHFWSSGSKPSLQFLPEIKSFLEKHRTDGFRVLGITLDENEERSNRIRESYDLTWPQLFDGRRWETPSVKQYEIQEIPRFILVSREGNIEYVNLRPPLLFHAAEKLLK